MSEGELHPCPSLAAGALRDGRERGTVGTDGRVVRIRLNAASSIDSRFRGNFQGLV